jgi:hypothetical protein
LRRGRCRLPKRPNSSAPSKAAAAVGGTARGYVAVMPWQARARPHRKCSLTLFSSVDLRGA